MSPRATINPTGRTHINPCAGIIRVQSDIHLESNGSVMQPLKPGRSKVRVGSAEAELDGHPVQPRQP